MRAAELRANRHRPSVVRSSQHRGRSGAGHRVTCRPRCTERSPHGSGGPEVDAGGRARAIGRRQGAVPDPHACACFQRSAKRSRSWTL